MKKYFAIVFFAMTACSLFAQQVVKAHFLNGRTGEDGEPVGIYWIWKDAPANAHAEICVVYVNEDGSERLTYNISAGSYNPPSGKLLWTPRVFDKSQEVCRIRVNWYLGSEYLPSTTASTEEFMVLLGTSRSIQLTYPESDVRVPPSQMTWIKWHSVGLPANAKIQIALQPVGEDRSIVIADLFNTGGYLWEIPSDFPRGSYLTWVRYINEYGIPGAISKGPVITVMNGSPAKVRVRAEAAP